MCGRELDIRSAGWTLLLKVCLQISSPTQDGSAHIWDILASFDAAAILTCLEPKKYSITSVILVLILAKAQSTNTVSVMQFKNECTSVFWNEEFAL